MTISVIIPVFKVEKYIRRCIESIIDQRCDGFTIECIIIDDASPDCSMDIVFDIINSYQGISVTFRIIKHDINKGLSEARNSGIRASTGDYIFFVDSDDAIYENSFKCFYSYLLKYPSVDVIMGNSFWVEQNYLSNTSVTNNNSPFLIDESQTIMHYVLRRKIDRTVWNKLIRRSIILDNNLFFDIGLLYEDVIWTYKLYSCISSIMIIPELTYIYDYNPSSIVHTPAERSNQMVWSFTYISNYLLNNPKIIDGKEIPFAAHRLFVYHWLLKAVDIEDKYGAEQKTCVSLKVQKQRLIWHSICHFRPFMTLFFLTLFRPFSVLFRTKLFRANFHRIERLVYILS